MDDDDFMPNYDPYDQLQEHNLIINRLIQAHNKQEKLLNQLAQNNAQMSEFLVKTNQRLDRAEQLLEQLLNNYAE